MFHPHFQSLLIFTHFSVEACFIKSYQRLTEDISQLWGEGDEEEDDDDDGAEEVMVAFEMSSCGISCHKEGEKIKICVQDAKRQIRCSGFSRELLQLLAFAFPRHQCHFYFSLILFFVSAVC